MEVEEYGVKKSWDGWRTFAYVRDGTPMGLMPITWANELFKTKQQANVFIKDLATKEWMEKMISKHLRDIKKLLKAYHKKWDCFGKPIKKPTKRKRHAKR
jgi:hypothetical protein